MKKIQISKEFKKIISLVTIFIIVAFLGAVFSYVKADYADPANTGPYNNTPAPILLNKNSNPFIKIGKLAVTDDVNKTIDSASLADNALVVMGQMASNGLSVSGTARVNAELETNSNLYPVFFGDPTDSSFIQKDGNGKPRTFLVQDHTRAPRIVVGNKTASGSQYNLYLAEGSNATNLGKNNSYCTLTADRLKSTGCPARTYMGQVFATSSNTGTDVVAACYDTTPSSSPASKGSCY